MESPARIPNHQDFHNYLRLLTLLNEHGTFALRKLFQTRYEALTASEWKDGSRAAKVFHQTVAKHVFKTCLPIQRKMLQDADLTKWDLALLSLVLQKINYSTNYPQITLDLEQERENKIIADLVQIRNSMEHQPGKSVPIGNFDILWQRASGNLLALGVSAEDIEHIRSCKDLHGIEFKNVHEGTVDDENNAKAKKLKEVGNAALKSGLITKAIRLYSTALNLYGVSSVERGILCSNRSLSYMKLMETPNSISEDEVNLNCELAMQDAKSAMQLRPLWFKGYSRVGKVFQFLKEWDSAIAAFDQALGLNVGDREILNARDSCRAMVNTASCHEHLQPIRMLNQMETQDYNDKMLAERGWTMPNAQKVLEMHQKSLKSNKTTEIKADAYIYVGHRYKQGTDGFPQNYEKAADYFTKAAEFGHPEGLQNIALLYHTGKGVPQDVYVAAEYFQKAANFSTKGMSPAWIQKGVVAAQYSLAVCYEKGIGKMQDYTEAVRWYTKAMESGNGQAANNLGHLYNQGLGVVRSQERAIQLWKLATSNGFSPALDNLIGMELSFGNFDKAEHYHSQLIETGNQLSSLRETRFHDILQQRERQKEMLNSLPLDQAEDLKAFSGGINKLFRNQAESPHTTSKESDSAFAKYWIGRQSLDIRRRASQGFVFAQTLLTSKEYFADGAELFVILADTDSGSAISLRNKSAISLRNKMLHAFANCFRTTEIVSVLPVQNQVRIVEIAIDTMRMCKEDVSPVDCDARVCYAILTAHSLQETIHFLAVSKIKYPKEVFFPDLQVNLHGFQNQFKEALEIALEALQNFPQHVGLLENKAKLLFYLSLSDPDPCMKNRAKKAFADFLEFAPVDHRKVPDVYYCLGQISMLEGQETFLTKADNYYDLGLQSEKNLLSCFIPYDSQHKTGLKLKIDLAHKTINYKPGSSNRRMDSNCEVKSARNNAATAPESKSKAGKNPKTSDDRDYVTQKSPFRIQLVLKHRQGIKSMLDEQKEIRRNDSSTNIVVETTCKPLNKQTTPTILAGLEEIKLDDMSRTTDRVYKGRILTVTIVEDSLFHLFPSVHCVVKDEDGEFQWGYFYNFDHKDPAVRKKFSFGSKLSILNPYHRLTGDGHSGIRVDDPQSVVFHSAGDDEGEELCRFCWKKNPSMRCGKCKRFKYCSKKCQIQDWRLLRHKDVCGTAFELFTFTKHFA